MGTRILRSRLTSPTAISRILGYAAAVFTASGMIFPFIWMIATSFKTFDRVFSWPPEFIPRPITLDNYERVFELTNFPRYFLNSVFVTSCCVAGVLFFDSLAGYAFAKYTFRGKKALFLIIIGTMMIPFHVYVIPMYYVTNILGWVDKYPALIIPFISGPFGIFLMRQFMISIPNDLIEAGRLDGCSEFRIYARIILPLCVPALATLAIFTFMGIWNDLFWPLIVINSDNHRTIQVGITVLRYHYVVEWNLVMAGTSLAVLPVFILFVSLQRFFIKGITLSGLKF